MSSGWKMPSWSSTQKNVGSAGENVGSIGKTMSSRFAKAANNASLFGSRATGYSDKTKNLNSVSYNNPNGLTQNNLSNSIKRLPQNSLSNSRNFTSNSNKKNTNPSPEFSEEFKASVSKGRMSNTFEQTKLTTGLAKIKNNYTKSLKFIDEITKLIKDYNNKKNNFKKLYSDLETKQQQLEKPLSNKVSENYKKQINTILTELYNTSTAIIASNKEIKDKINELQKLGDNKDNIKAFLKLLDNNIIDYTRMYTSFFEKQAKENKVYPYGFTVTPFNPVVKASAEINENLVENNENLHEINRTLGVTPSGINRNHVENNANRVRNNKNPIGNNRNLGVNTVVNYSEINETSSGRTNVNPSGKPVVSNGAILSENIVVNGSRNNFVNTSNRNNLESSTLPVGNSHYGGNKKTKRPIKKTK